MRLSCAGNPQHASSPNSSQCWEMPAVLSTRRVRGNPRECLTRAAPPGGDQDAHSVVARSAEGDRDPARAGNPRVSGGTADVRGGSTHGSAPGSAPGGASEDRDVVATRDRVGMARVLATPGTGNGTSDRGACGEGASHRGEGTNRQHGDAERRDHGANVLDPSHECTRP